MIQVKVKRKGTAFFQREGLLSQMHSFIGQINMPSAPPICPCSTGTEVKDGLSPTVMELPFYISDIRTFDPKPEWTVGSFHDQEVHGHYGGRGPVERNFHWWLPWIRDPGDWIYLNQEGLLNIYYVTITSDMQMTPPLWQKVKKN